MTPAPPSSPSIVASLVAERRILISAGPGGVGKTTVAAALGVLAARAGRRVLVATIDPAPRLADALGIANLGADPAALSAPACEALRIPEGRLHAARIDTALTFSRLVEQQVSDAAMRRRIFDNAIYRQMTSTLTGSQEYAATLALYDYVQGGAFDLVVLDTPPTANALEFLDAPRRITEAVSSPAVRWFARPDGSQGRFSLQRLRSGGALVIQRLGKFVGSVFLDDLGAFLTDFQGVLGGFLERARAIDGLLRRPDVAFLLVLAPELPAVNEALFFHERLREAGLALEAFIANRVLPPPAVVDPERLREQLITLPGVRALDPSEQATGLDDLAAAVEYLTQTAVSQRQQIARLHERDPDVPVVELPLLAHEVSTLAALATIAGGLG